MQRRQGARESLIVRSIWASCLLIATANHLHILWLHGLFWDYGGAHWTSAAYWTGLTLLDPVVAVLLFARPKLGIVATIALITTNVVHNLTIMVPLSPEGGFLLRAASTPFVASQVLFMGFVWATAFLAWRGVGTRSVQASRTS